MITTPHFPLKVSPTGKPKDFEGACHQPKNHKQQMEFQPKSSINGLNKLSSLARWRCQMQS
jgi:hypothetical protein